MVSFRIGLSFSGTLGIAVVVYLLGSLRVLWQYERGVVFLLGAFEDVRGPGLTLIICARLRCKSRRKNDHQR